MKIDYLRLRSRRTEQLHSGMPSERALGADDARMRATVLRARHSNLLGRTGLDSCKIERDAPRCSHYTSNKVVKDFVRPRDALK
jgi:hypothetical protein